MSYKMIGHNTISSLIPEAQGGEETVDKNNPEEKITENGENGENIDTNGEDNKNDQNLENNEPNTALTEEQNDELKKIAIAHKENGEEGWSDENDYRVFSQKCHKKRPKTAEKS